MKGANLKKSLRGECWTEIGIQQHVSENGVLTVLADEGHPFQVQRVFVVQGNSGDLRGQHAHRTCTQLLACVKGEIEVTLHNSEETATFALRPGQFGLLVPPMVWGSQRFLDNENVMIVLADSNYDEAEYIRDWDEFVILTVDSTDA